MKKLLLMFVALFTMGTMAVYADETLNITDEGLFKTWGSEEFTVNDDGSVTLTFTGAWGGEQVGHLQKKIITLVP